MGWQATATGGAASCTFGFQHMLPAVLVMQAASELAALSDVMLPPVPSWRQHAGRQGVLEGKAVGLAESDRRAHQMTSKPSWIPDQAAGSTTRNSLRVLKRHGHLMHCGPMRRGRPTMSACCWRSMPGRPAGPLLRHCRRMNEAGSELRRKAANALDINRNFPLDHARWAGRGALLHARRLRRLPPPPPAPPGPAPLTGCLQAPACLSCPCIESNKYIESHEGSFKVC